MPNKTIGWMEIFKGGKQVDSSGREHDGDAIIERALNNFNAAEHEPPLVIGHPKENGPAYGWVKGLKAETVGGVKRLFAQTDQVAPEFKELVTSGRFKKRSASFYGDGRLRHVGFLGAMPPAVKGLADAAFAEGGEVTTFEFEESGTVARLFRRLRDWLIEEKGAEKADSIISNWDVEYLQTEANRPRESEIAVPMFAEGGEGGATNKEGVMPVPKSFSEAEVKTASEQAAAAARADERKKVAAEFAEQQRTERATARKAEIKSFCEAGGAAGNLPPAWLDGGLAQFMESLPAEETVDFGEAGGKKSPYAWFTEFLQSMPKLVDFKEVATRGTDLSTGPGSAGDKLTALVNKKLADNRELSYTSAFAEVQREHPDLATEYQQELG